MAVAVLEAGKAPETVARAWVKALRRTALTLFEARALPGLSEHDVKTQREITQAHRRLNATFAGHGDGAKAYQALSFSPPEKVGSEKRKKETA